MDKGEPELQEPPMFLLTTMPIFSIRKKDNVIFIDTDITGEPCLGCGSHGELLSPPPLKQIQSMRFT